MAQHGISFSTLGKYEPHTHWKKYPWAFHLVAQCTFLSALWAGDRWSLTFSCKSCKANMCQSRWTNSAPNNTTALANIECWDRNFVWVLYFPLSSERPVRSHCILPTPLSPIPTHLSQAWTDQHSSFLGKKWSYSTRLQTLRVSALEWKCIHRQDGQPAHLHIWT